MAVDDAVHSEEIMMMIELDVRILHFAEKNSFLKLVLDAFNSLFAAINLVAVM